MVGTEKPSQQEMRENKERSNKVVRFATSPRVSLRQDPIVPDHAVENVDPTTTRIASTAEFSFHDNTVRQQESGTAGVGVPSRLKRSRPERPNEDEMDDVDDWKPDDDTDEVTGIPTEQELLRAKRQRRLKREHALAHHAPITSQSKNPLSVPEVLDDDDNNDVPFNLDAAIAISKTTRIDQSTSLAAEGIPIEPFHMEQERTDGLGYFEGDTYVFRRRAATEEDEQDAWLESLDDEHKQSHPSKSDVERRIDSWKSHFEHGTKSEKDKTTNNIDRLTQEELYARLLPLVSDSETVMQALARYGNLIRSTQKLPKRPHPRKHALTEVPNTADCIKTEQYYDEDDNAPSSKHQADVWARNALNELTELSNALLFKGQSDVYQKTRHDILLLLRSRDNVAREAGAKGQEGDLQMAANASEASHRDEDRTSIQWEYQGSEDGQVHGPYRTEQMIAWIAQGYFVGPSAVLVRPVRSARKEAPLAPTSLQDDLLADLMDDEDGVGGLNDLQEDARQKHNAGVSCHSRGENSADVERGEWMLSDDVPFAKYA